MQRAMVLFGCYRRADAADPETYTAAIAAILSEYEREVVAYVTDPRTGLPRKSNFLPTVCEVDKACSEHANFLKAKRGLEKAGWRFENGQWIKPEKVA